MGNLQNFINKPFARIGKVDPFGLFQGPKPPTPPTPPPTPPNLGSTLSSQSRTPGPPLGGTFLTSSEYDKKPSTTGQKTLLGQ